MDNPSSILCAIMRLVVGISTISGRGVFAGKDFKPGETICRFAGRIVSVDDLRRIYKTRAAKVSCDALQVGVRKYLLIDEPFVLINHSCSPNAAFKNERTLVAKKRIRKGEELFYDYSATEWTPRDYTEYNHAMWPMRCTCGSRNCRGLIACFPYLPKRLQRAYLAGTIQDHVRKKLDLPETARRCDVCEARIAASKKRG